MYIIHLGFSGFPMEGYASVQRIKLTFKGLKEVGLYPLIINKQSEKHDHLVSKINRHDGIPYISTSYLTYQPANFWKRNLNKLSGIVGELILLTKKRKKIDTAILYTSSFSELVYYRLISKLYNFHLIIQYVELRSSFTYDVPFFIKTNGKLFDKYFFRFCDGVIAISEYLVNHVTAKSAQLPLIKLPAICDFSEFNSIKPYPAAPYLMYCGNNAYLEIIEFIINIYVALRAQNKYNGSLVLVISGDFEANAAKIRSQISALEVKDDIILKSHIPYPELLSLYKGADALFIPLRDTLQDNARFPHKIGEYTASKRPIVTTNLGEPKKYFTDGISAILVKDFTHDAYVAKLSSVLSSRDNLDKMGSEGYQIGLQNFDYKAQATILKQFIATL